MTREELSLAIYLADSICPDNLECKLADEEKFEGGCEECAEKQLAEYEKQIKVDMLDEFLKKLDMHVAYMTTNEGVTPHVDWHDVIDVYHELRKELT